MSSTANPNETIGSPADEKRRDFLLIATATVAAAGTALAVWPFIDSMNPAKDVLAVATSDLDLEPIEVGQRVTVIWRGKPVFVDHRTPEEIHAARADVNVFASWCVACLEEHPLLTDLSRRDVVAVHGLNYKDKPDDAERWLDRLGDPYTRTGADRDGRVAIDWGVYGVPETFVVDRRGRIVHKHIGAINKADLEETILPLIEELSGRNKNQ